MTRKNLIIVFAGTCLTFILSAWFIGRSIERFKKEDRYISVKGFAEREVKADLVIWTLKVGIGSNDPQEGSAAMETAKSKVIQFLLRNGISRSEITQKDLTVQDRQEHAYEAANARYTFRYLLRESIEVRSQKVDLVQQVSRKTGDLLNAGVVLSTEEWNGAGLKFIFTKLNTMRKASQGLFSIQDRDEFLSSQNENGQAYAQGKSDLFKTVRVVISVDYTVE
jgi:hypothetical protein